METPKAQRSSRKSTPAVATIITTCSNRKKIRPRSGATAGSLPEGSQIDVLSAWFERLKTLPAEVRMDQLYAGRGFALAVRAAADSEAKLCVLSAGLGLVEASQRLPSYGLTVTRGYSDSLPEKISGEFNVTAWFSAILEGPYSRRWTDIFGQSGRILLALTHPYAQMIGASLLESSADALSRIRIFGARLAEVLPEALWPAIAPYDARLDAIIPGTRVDFSQRALFHFVNTVLPSAAASDRQSDFAMVEAALSDATAPERPRRPRRSDEDILQLIVARLETQSGIGRILHALRSEEGVACEQSRFSRLYRTAVELRPLA